VRIVLLAIGRLAMAGGCWRDRWESCCRLRVLATVLIRTSILPILARPADVGGWRCGEFETAGHLGSLRSVQDDDEPGIRTTGCARAEVRWEKEPE
jgi:hypothetical protein